MADENKEYVVKLTAETDQFIAGIKGIDRIVNDMNNEIARTNRLFSDMSTTFRLMVKDAMSFGPALLSAQRELEGFMKTVSESASAASQMQQAVQSTQGAVQNIGDVGKKTAEALKATGEEASNAGQMIEQASKKASKDALKEAEIVQDAKKKAAEKNKLLQYEAKVKQELLELDEQRKRNQKEYEDAQSANTSAVVEEKSTPKPVEPQNDLTENVNESLAHTGSHLSKVVDMIRAKLNPAWAESQRRAARIEAYIEEQKRQLADIDSTRFHSDLWRDYQKQINDSRSAMNAAAKDVQNIKYEIERADMFNLKDGPDFGKETEEFKDLKHKLKEAVAAVDMYREKLVALEAAQAALNEGVGKPGNENPQRDAIVAKIEALVRQREMTLLSGSGLLGKLRKHTHRESQKITTILKNTLNHIKSFFSKITNLSNGKNTERGLKRIADAFTRLWGMFKTRLKRRFISAVFEDAKQDMVQLAKAFPSMNDAISNVVNSAKALGAQLLAILQPIITALGPLVSKVLDAATVAADKIAQFSAKLFGQDLYGKASKGNYDFAKSMDDTTKSVNEANNALSDYSSNLLGFDKLNQLQATNNGTGATIKAEETEPVKDNAFNRWAEELKENWDNKDWSGFGTTLANGLNDAINWINNQDWDALSDKVTGFIANIQEAFNGFIHAFDAEAVGHLIGRIGNLLIDAWKQLVKPVEEGGFDFHTLGAKIGTMLVTALKDIKWDEAGQALGNTGNRLAELFRGILEQKFTDEEGEHTLGYGIGKAITTFITNALKSIDVDSWATLIGELFDNLLDMFIQIFSAGPDLGAKIAEILNKSLKKIDAKKLGEAISGLSRTFNSLIESIDWGQVVSKLGDALSHVDWGSAIKSIFFIRMGKKIGSFFNNTLGNLFGGGASKGLFGGGLLSGLLGKVFGKGGSEGGGGLFSGLFGKLKEWFTSLPGKISTLFTTVKGWLTALPGKISELFVKAKGLLSTLSGKISSLFSTLSGKLGGLFTNLSGKLGNLFTNVTGKISNFFSAHPVVGGVAAVGAALWAGNEIGRAISQDDIEAYHEFADSGEILDLSELDGFERWGLGLIAGIDRLTGAFDGFSKKYDEAREAETDPKKIEEYNAAKFGKNMANGVSEAMTQAARDRNGAFVDSQIANQILHDYENNISRDKLENRYGMSVEDMNSRYGLNMQYDGQTSALTETIQNNTTAMQSVEASTNTSAEAMTKAADYMKSMFESLQKDTSDGQPVNLMIDGYKFGEFVLKQLGTLMHVKLAAT